MATLDVVVVVHVVVVVVLVLVVAGIVGLRVATRRSRRRIAAHGDDGHQQRQRGEECADGEAESDQGPIGEYLLGVLARVEHVDELPQHVCWTCFVVRLV